MIKNSVAISQPRYLPALNYLHRLANVHYFVIFDTVQRNGRDFENRNKLLIPEPSWLTISISSGSRETIKNTQFKDLEWVSQHRETVKRYYGNHPFFNDDFLNAYYNSFADHDHGLSFSRAIGASYSFLCEFFGLQTQLIYASELEATPERGPAYLRAICEELDSRLYVSGPNGRDYGVFEEFENHSIDCRVHEFPWETYNQKGHEEFVPYLGFLDFVFNNGIEKLSELLGKPLNLSDR